MNLICDTRYSAAKVSGEKAKHAFEQLDQSYKMMRRIYHLPGMNQQIGNYIDQLREKTIPPSSNETFSSHPIPSEQSVRMSR